MQHVITRRLILQKARSHPTRGLLPFVSYWFQVLFHSPLGVLFTFPSRYWFTIGHHGVFSLGWWSTRIPTRFLVSGRTQELLRSLLIFGYGAFTLSGATSQLLLLTKRFLTPVRSPTTPASPKTYWFGLVRFRSPLLSESRLISTPPGTKMVQFPGYIFVLLCIHNTIYGHYPVWVPPFGNRRINACLQLPAAFRSLPRPSSPHGAKASSHAYSTPFRI